MALQQGAVGAHRSFSFAPRAASGSLWLALALVSTVAFFWGGLVSLLDAWTLPEYGHGYLIGPIALYLFLRQAMLEADRGLDQRVAVRRGLGVAAVVIGLAFGLVGNLAQIPAIATYGFIITLAGLVLVMLGVRRGLGYWAPVFYLVFMLPLPSFLYWKVSGTLQLISSELGVRVISALGVPVLLSGNVIDLGTYQLQVAEACSGLRYLFPLASFGFLFAVLYRGPLWHKALLVLSTAPITVFMNAFRIGVIGVMVDRFGPAMAEGFLHLFEGWFIFVACIVILYAEAMILQRLTRGHIPVHRMLEVDVAGLGRQLGKLARVPSSAALVAASTLIAVAALVTYTAPTRAFEPVARQPLVLFPMTLGAWSGRTTLLDRDVEAVLKADDYLEANFVAPGAAAPVSLFVAYYKSQTNGSGIHSPEVCLPAGGWEVSQWTTFDSGVTRPTGEPLSVNRAIIQMGLDRRLVYYWFEEQGRALTNDWMAKAYTVFHSVTRGRMDGALVRVITPITGPVESADARLRDFLKLALPALPAHVPL